jgi:solute carrier family 25 protein 34/35
MFSGATCGAFGAAVASPLFLVKTRMQSFSMAYPVGTQHAYVRKGLVHSFVTISKNEGLASIFKGVEVGIMRTAVGSAIQLSTYTTLKSRFAQWGLGAETDLRNNLPASLLTVGAESSATHTCFHN